MISAAPTTLPWPMAVRYEIRRCAIGERCELPSRSCGCCGRRTHAWLVRPNHSQPRAGLHVFPASAPACRICSHHLPALLCILMHISSANASMCEDACMVGTHTQKLCTRVMRPASLLQYSILRPPPRHHQCAATCSCTTQAVLTMCELSVLETQTYITP
ncbi:hypothetical protein V8C35DRAFT_6255 [Trichoderma chlorosporum]